MMHRCAALFLVLVAVAGSQAAPPRNDYLVIEEFHWAPQASIRAETVDLVFRVANHDRRDHEVEVFLALEPVHSYLDGSSCPSNGGCSHVIDINEHAEVCSINGVSRQTFTIRAGDSVTVSWWSWDVAQLACAPPTLQPVAGEYQLALYVQEWKQMGKRGRRLVASDACRKPFYFAGLDDEQQ